MLTRARCVCKGERQRASYIRRDEPRAEETRADRAQRGFPPSQSRESRRRENEKPRERKRERNDVKPTGLVKSVASDPLPVSSSGFASLARLYHCEVKSMATPDCTVSVVPFRPAGSSSGCTRMRSAAALMRAPRRLLWAPTTALGWLLVAFVTHGLLLRVLVLPRVLDKWANTHERAWGVAVVGLVLGAVEDATAAMGASISLWLVGVALFNFTCAVSPSKRHVEATMPAAASWNSSMALLVASHFVLSNAVLCVDLVFVSTRLMRFQWDFVLLFWRSQGQDDAWKQLQVEDREWLIAAGLSAVTMLFAVLLAVRLPLSDLPYCDRHLWHALQWVHAECSHVVWRPFLRPGPRASRSPMESPVALATTSRSADVREHAHDVAPLLLQEPDDDRGAPSHRLGIGRRLLRVLLLWLLVVVITIGLTKVVPSVVAMIAWNASLCEPLRVLAGVECVRVRPIHISKRLQELLDTTTERCEFLDLHADTLVRRTLGFQGPVTFDVSVAPHEAPNVLIVVVESFRQRDSRWLLRPEHVDQFLPGNLSLTPQFDHWASRGIGFRNMWSTWRTSRSLEQILYAQLPLDSPTDSGTTDGHADVHLSGLPQLLKAKGYETLFTTGSRVDYDDWDQFLPSHGFDTVLSGWNLADIAQEELGIDWTRGDHMMAFWGMHDDLTFDVLAHLLRTKEEAKRRGQGKPFFATHYTISSHVPFDERPDWYYRRRENGELPDFSSLYRHIQDAERQELVKNYAEMRYFTDMTFGAFMRQLEASGVLNDTIVIVTGDHGHAPERGTAMPEEDQVGAMNVPGVLIAEGRLGEYAGTIVEEAVAQYDWLNTIADVVGLPREGFVQTGVGRSLKRKPVDADRVVYSHNPALNLAAVQGHTRIEFYPDLPDVLRVYNIQRDPERQFDLLSELPKTRVADLHRICDEARALNAYFTERWRHKCMLPPTCTST